MRCDQCKFWMHEERDPDLEYPPPHAGWRTCTLPRQPAELAGIDASELMPGDGYASIYTAPDFGCVKFQQIG